MLSNNDIKILTSLQKKKYRNFYQSFLIEGEKLIKDAIEENFPLKKIIICPEYTSPTLHTVIEIAANNNIPIYETSEKQIKKISYVKTPQPVIAVGEIASHEKNIELFIKEWDKILVLDQIQDPGNLGTLIRTADWFGISGIVLSEGNVDIYNPKVVRGSMGSMFRVPIISDINLIEMLPVFRENQITILAADATGTPINRQFPKPDKWALILGNEGQGLSDGLPEIADQIISIPGNTKADSLNVGISGAIIIYQLTV